MEDLVGAGAVCDSLTRMHGYSPAADGARIAMTLFHAAKNDLPAILRSGQGGQNLLRAGLEEDIEFCARLNVLDVVGVVSADLTIRAM